MIKGQPLSNIENGSVVPRKRYGKKAMSGLATFAAKDIFTHPTDLASHFEKLQVNDATIQQEKTESDSSTELISTVIRPTCRSRTRPTTNEQQEAPSVSIQLCEKAQPQDGKCTRKRSVTTGVDRSNKAKSRAPVPKVCKRIQDLCDQFCDRPPLSFESYGRKIAKVCNVEKIGEGAYSSVFALTPKECQSSQNSQSSLQSIELHDMTIIKLMPILLPSPEQQQGQTEPSHIANELETMQTVDSVHGFIRYRGLTVVHGTWPSNFLTAFRKFAVQHRVKAENEDPDDAYTPDQYYALVEMEYAGQELSDVLDSSKGRRPSVFQIWDVIWQTCIHLAQAESQCGFEHRDLHVSNICIRAKDSSSEHLDTTLPLVKDMSKRPRKLLGLSNLKVTIIDYTFSRATISKSDPDKIVNYREFVLDGEGYETQLKKYIKDAKKIGNSGPKFEDRLQQLTYAKAAHCVAQACAARKDGRHTCDSTCWKQSTTITNVCWLGYLVACLLSRAGKTSKTKYLTGSSEMSKDVQNEMYASLGQLKETLLKEDITQLPRSADDVLRLGIKSGWIGKDELELFKARLEEES